MSGFACTSSIHEQYDLKSYNKRGIRVIRFIDDKWLTGETYRELSKNINEDLYNYGTLRTNKLRFWRLKICSSISRSKTDQQSKRTSQSRNSLSKFESTELLTTRLTKLGVETVYVRPHDHAVQTFNGRSWWDDPWPTLGHLSSFNDSREHDPLPWCSCQT